METGEFLLRLSLGSKLVDLFIFFTKVEGERENA